MYLTKSKTILSISLSLGLILLYSTFLGYQFFVNAQIPNNQSENLLSFENQTNNNNLYTLAERVEDRLQKAATMLEFTSILPEVRNITFGQMLNETIEEFKGVPQDVDTSKREIAKHLLQENKDFVVVFFLVPNGDLYMLEPYSLQQNLSRTNFAFRDYYQDVINTKDTVLGNAIISAASGLSESVVAVPIYETNGTLLGIWAATLKLDNFSKNIQSLNLTNDQRIIYLDNIGQKVADSDKLLSNRNESFSNLQSFKNAINGQSGIIIETVNGTEMLISYHPIEVGSNTWVILSLQPSNTHTGSMNYSVSNPQTKNAEDEITIQNTSMSKPAPVRHPGQPPHEVVFALPLRQDGKVYSGTVTFTASKPIEVEVLHTYAPQQEIDSAHGEPYHALLPGNNSIAITHLRDLIDKSLEVNATQISSGTIDFVGNALVFHKTSGEPFTVTYTIDYKVKDLTNDNSI